MNNQDFPEKILRSTDVIALQDNYFFNQDQWFYFYSFHEVKDFYFSLFHKDINRFGILKINKSLEVVEIYDWDKMMGNAPFPSSWVADNLYSVSYLNKDQINSILKKEPILNKITPHITDEESLFLIKYILKGNQPNP